MIQMLKIQPVLPLIGGDMEVGMFALLSVYNQCVNHFLLHVLGLGLMWIVILFSSLDAIGEVTWSKFDLNDLKCRYDDVITQTI